MVQAWYMDADTGDKHSPHHRSPPEYISIEDLCQTTGVQYYKMNLSTYATDRSLVRFRGERSFTFEDEITCSAERGQDMLDKFWVEHLHTDEEIRLVLEGSAYFDVRDVSDLWIRIHLLPGDLVVLPSGCYHRFTLDHHSYVKLRRFHIGEPAWVSYNRPAADPMPCRHRYLAKRDTSAAQAC